MREPAHGLREWPRAMARRGRRLPDLGISAPSGFARILARARDGDRFSTIDNRGRRCLREPAHGLRERPRAMARRGRRLPDLAISAPSVVACILARARDGDRFSTIDDRGRRCLRKPAHGLRAWPRAIARRGRLLPDLRISAPSVVACILARAGDATDFRPSINGAGGACASRRTVWESSRERWRDGAGCYRTSGFRPPRSLHAYWRGRATRPIFDHR